MDKDFYNKSSSDSLEWYPSWFGCKYFDEDLVKAVKVWQRENGLTADGLVGPMTYRRIWTERESRISEFKPYTYDPKDSAFIVHNGRFIPINWGKVILWSERGGLKSLPGTYYSHGGSEDRKPTMFVNHWDVCLSSESCAKVLARRGISIHFCIDNDGTIYQLLDTQHAAWHAGNSKVNRCSIGVEISNAYYTKYQDWYVNHGFGERPVWEDVSLHGKSQKPFLGFYDVQVEAAKSLWRAIHDGMGIPLECPLDSNGEMLTTSSTDVSSSKFNGFVHHFHVTKRKIDCAGFDLKSNLDDVVNNKRYCIDRG
tara:strand:- start:1723 stop:2655 length:933 start_codon:yes stop_codon:yes gene_type:complete